MVAISKSNQRVRQLRKLTRKSAYRYETKTFVIEGLSLLKEAISTGHTPIDVFVKTNDDSLLDLLEGLITESPKVWHLDEDTIRYVTSTKNPQPVLASVPMMDVEFSHLMDSSPEFIVVAAGINDPGNAGTLIRSAAASGADGIVFSEDSVDIFNSKVVRATAGSLFRIPVVRSVAMSDFFDSCSSRGISTYGLCGQADTQYDLCEYSSPLALLVGNESAGLGSATREKLDVEVGIPMQAGVESLNAGSALSVVSFEVRRQRKLNASNP
ncbi:MAG: RNA methyltransferase [Acidimicrobiales bacterium]|jgi:RNA methyltransferase, TrmH family|nr:RNA methyltransferase [Acidimicrobiales bacterium]